MHLQVQFGGRYSSQSLLFHCKPGFLGIQFALNISALNICGRTSQAEEVQPWTLAEAQKSGKAGVVGGLT